MKTQISSSHEIYDVQKKRLYSFCTGVKSVRILVRHQELVSIALHGKAGCVDREAAKEDMEDSRDRLSLRA